MEALFNNLQRWASAYIKGYYTDDQQIQAMMALKEEHTEFVVQNAERLARELELSVHDMYLCKIIALLHDIGRFEQYTRYQTFNDRLSEDHARLGLNVIKGLPLLERLTNDERRILELAIANHNKREIDKKLDTRTQLFAQIIRDADKLDIYRVLEPLTEPSDGSGYSEDIADCLLAGRQCDYTYIRTLDDRKLVRLLWLYNIYYTWTLREIKRQGYIEKLLAKLPDDEKIRVGTARLRQYIEEKIAKKDKCIF